MAPSAPEAREHGPDRPAASAAGCAIRPATIADVPALARLRHEFRSGLEPAVEPEMEFLRRCAAWMAQRMEDHGRWRCWVADGGPMVVGTVWLQLVEKIPNPVGEHEWHGYVSSLYVRPAFRGAGLGSALLQACLRECMAREVDAVFLWPTTGSRSLYLRHGFSAQGDLLERRLEVGIRRAESGAPSIPPPGGAGPGGVLADPGTGSSGPIRGPRSEA